MDIWGRSFQAELCLLHLELPMLPLPGPQLLSSPLPLYSPHPLSPYKGNLGLWRKRNGRCPNHEGNPICTDLCSGPIAWSQCSWQELTWNQTFGAIFPSASLLRAWPGLKAVIFHILVKPVIPMLGKKMLA